MILEDFLKKIAAFFPKLIIKLDGTNHEAQLKSKFLASLRRVQVDTYIYSTYYACMHAVIIKFRVFVVTAQSMVDS